MRRLINSVRRRFSKIKIVVADDSPKECREDLDVDFANVTHILLPPVNDTDGTGSGWFAGRNAALSQVETEYFIWMDDDFAFQDAQHAEVLEKMFNVIEKSGFDIIAGSAGQKSLLDWIKGGRFTVRPGLAGPCVDQIQGSYGRLPNFPKCFVRDLVLNFFIGRTLEVSKVRFDPSYKRMGHIAFFLDALNKLRIAWCPEYYVLNDPGHCDRTYWHEELRVGECGQYDAGRHPPQIWTRRQIASQFSRSYQQCSGRKISFEKLQKMISSMGYLNHTLYEMEAEAIFNLMVEKYLPENQPNQTENEPINDIETESDGATKHENLKTVEMNETRTEPVKVNVKNLIKDAKSEAVTGLTIESRVQMRL